MKWFNLSTESKTKSSIVPSSVLKRQDSIDRFITTDKVSITITKELLIQSIVSSVAAEGIPIRYFSTDSYKMSNGELAYKLGVSLTRDSVRRYVIEAAQRMKDDISKAGVNIYLKYYPFSLALYQVFWIFFLFF